MSHGEPATGARVASVLQEWQEPLTGAAERGRYLLVSHQARFLNPLVPAEAERLGTCVAVLDSSLREFVAHRLLPALAADALAPGLYFPVPMARTVAAAGGQQDGALAAAFARFHYDMAQVDSEQRWTWRGQSVADRTRDFFLDHLYWEPVLGRWAFEYKVHDGWWDKSYLDAALTPLRAVQLETGARQGLEGARLVLQTGRRVAARLDTLRLDEAERMFCDGVGVGSVLISDALRFQLLATVDDELTSVEIQGRRWPLRWPS